MPDHRALAALIRDRKVWISTDPANRGAAFIEVTVAEQIAIAAALEDGADAIEALNQRGHVAEFREDGYALEHPLECRKAGLLNCAVDKACGYEQAPPALGRFKVSIDDDGFLILGEEVPHV